MFFYICTVLDTFGPDRSKFLYDRICRKYQVKEIIFLLGWV